MATEPNAVWVAESNVIFRRGMISCLNEAAITVAGHGPRLPQGVDLRRVVVLVTELDPSGLVAAAAARAATDGLRLVGIASVDQPEMLHEAVNAGFSGLLLRSEPTPDGLVGTVHTVISGAGSIPIRTLKRLLDDPDRASRPRSGHGILSQREVAVLRLLAHGSSTREIAGELCYSERTVKNIVHDTLSKLNCRTRTQAVAVMTPVTVREEALVAVTVSGRLRRARVPVGLAEKAPLVDPRPVAKWAITRVVIFGPSFRAFPSARRSLGRREKELAAEAAFAAAPSHPATHRVHRRAAPR